MKGRARVIRCARCNAIYPHRRSLCPTCGSEQRIIASVPLEELHRARLRQGVPLRELRVPRAVLELTPPVPLWQRAVAWVRARIPRVARVAGRD